MKKLSSGLMALVCAVALAGCGQTEAPASSVEEVSSEVVVSSESVVEESSESSEEAAESSEEVVETAAVMTYAEYDAAELQTEVNVEMYVQAHQSWWDNKVTVYAADKDGAYFIYEMACSEEDAAKLVPGTKILVNGFKAAWAGEVEITDATFEFAGDDTFVAEAKDVTEFVGTDDIASYMNQLVTFTDMTVEMVSYKNDQPGDDIYVTLSKDGVKVEFCLEYYLNGNDEELYNTVGNLEVGSVVDVTGFLYWYEGPDAHITAVTVK